MRILYIARYHQPTMERKIHYMSMTPGTEVLLVRPSVWQDGYGVKPLPVRSAVNYRVNAIPMIGHTNDPHRALYRTLSFAMHRFRPDIVHAEEEPDSLVSLQVLLARRALAPGAKLVLHTWQNINRPKSRSVWWVTRRSLRAAEAILCANSEAGNVLMSMGYKGVWRVVPPQGVDVDTFRPAEKRPQRTDHVILYVGRLVVEKGLDTLIQAVAQLGSGVRLQLLGDGPMKDNLRCQAESAGIGDRVTFLDPVPVTELPRYLQEADVLVLPSRTGSIWKEQFGRVLIEAMACGTPVVGSDSGAIPEVIGDAGLVFPEGDASALEACLRQILASADYRDNLSARAHARAISLYSQETIARQTIDFYQELLEGNTTS